MSDYPRCYRCGRPAVCFGADLVAPKHRCPRCCRIDHHVDHRHGDAEHLNGHVYSHGFGGLDA